MDCRASVLLFCSLENHNMLDSAALFHNFSSLSLSLSLWSGSGLTVCLIRLTTAQGKCPTPKVASESDTISYFTLTVGILNLKSHYPYKWC